MEYEEFEKHYFNTGRLSAVEAMIDFTGALATLERCHYLFKKHNISIDIKDCLLGVISHIEKTPEYKRLLIPPGMK